MSKLALYTSLITFAAATTAMATTCTQFTEGNIGAMYNKYSTLTHNNQAAEKQALKARIAAETDGSKDLVAEAQRIDAMHQKYNSLTHNNQAAEKQQLKAQIAQATEALDTTCKSRLSEDDAMRYALVRGGNGNEIQYFDFTSDDLRNTVITVLFNNGKGTVAELQSKDNPALLAMMP